MADKKTKGLMKVLMVVGYKKGKIYIRQMGDDVFLWDAVFKGELYSSYLVITPDKKKKKLTKRGLEEVVKMCYAGAAATIDYQLGIKLSKSEKQAVAMFERATKNIEKLKKEIPNA